MKLEESQKQRLPDLGQPDGAPPPYGLDTSPSLAVSDSDAEIDFDSKAILDKFPHELTFLFLPDVVDLEARLEVYAKDVPRLMEQGFYWTEANVRKRGRYFLLDRESIPADAWESGWNYARVYQLADIAKDGDPQWIAILRVYAEKLSVLSEFRVCSLSVDEIFSAQAFDEKGRAIYFFDGINPGESFNAICDDRPLQGWWPWPKKSQG